MQEQGHNEFGWDFKENVPRSGVSEPEMYVVVTQLTWLLLNIFQFAAPDFSALADEIRNPTNAGKGSQSKSWLLLLLFINTLLLCSNP